MLPTMKKNHINNSANRNESDDDVDSCRHPSRYSIGTDGTLSVRTAARSTTTTRDNGTMDRLDTKSTNRSPRSTSSTLSSPASSPSASPSSSSRSRSFLKMMMIPKALFKSSSRKKKSEKKNSSKQQRTSVFCNGNGKGGTTNSTGELSMHDDDYAACSSPPKPSSSRDSTTEGSADATTSEIVNKIEELIDIAVF
mmetsp:Transcript_35813/g.86403  ORF Transcript_35813/g.86403 Transcript_35813/m.86403 type:complete len:196 (+) Transcript_35813:249-836(+)